MRTKISLVSLVIALYSNGLQAAPEDFPRPPALQPQVSFWTKIFSEYSVHQAVIHDDLLVDKIHRVLDFRSLNSSNVSQATYWRKRKAAERRAKAEIVDMLRKIQRVGGDRSKLNKQERHLRDRYAAYTSRTKYSNAAARVRSQGGLKERFSEAIIISGRYLPYMENVFRKEGLPIELTRLPFVESSFNLNAYSSVAAAGIWQFMPSSGRIYKLRQNDVVDDRRDPWFATHAAAKHLKDDYARLKDWGLAVTAYNHGRAGVARAVRSVKGNGIEHVVKQYKGRRFGFASRNFYTSFLAAVDVVNDYERHFGKLNREPLLRFDEVRIKDYVDFGTLASLAGLNVAQFTELNPGFHPAVRKGKLRVPPNYVIRVPLGRADSFNEKYAALGPGNRFRGQKSYYVHHKVRRGESLGLIARKYDSNVATIMRTNSLRSAHRIRVGQVLKIPSSDSRPAKASVYAGSITNVSSTGNYRVRRGDTPSAIAKRHGLSVAALMQANKGVDARRLRIGQSLVIPGSGTRSGGSARASSGRGSKIHVVRSGDVMGAIAKRYDVSVASIMRANKGVDPRRLRIGQSLVIPGAATHSGGSTRASSGGLSKIHVVRSGEVMGAIAKRYGVSVASIMRANNMRNAHRLNIGQRLKIPGAASESAIPVAHRVRAGQTLSAIAERYGTTVHLIQRHNNLKNAHSIRVGQVLQIPSG